MAYIYSFQQSPNYWKGRSSAIKEIAIHWWGDPNAGYSHAGVVATLCNPARQASAHYVVSAGKVTQLVKEEDTSWATGKANPWTISIECQPLARDADYKTIAEVISEIRSRHGNLPLVPHNKYAATQCPGWYDLNRLNDLAKGSVMKISMPQGRIAWSEVLGRPLARTHKGEFDADIVKHAGEKTWSQWLQELWSSKEAEKYRVEKVRNQKYFEQKPVHDSIKAERDMLEQALGDAKATIAQLSTRPTKAEYQEMEAKLNGIIVDLETALEEEKQNQPTPEDVAKNAFERLILWIKELWKS